MELYRKGRGVGISYALAGTVVSVYMADLTHIFTYAVVQHRINKEEESGKTLTKIKKLDEESKLGEIVRLTGSVNSTAARQHAEELINQFKK